MAQSYWNLPHFYRLDDDLCHSVFLFFEN